MASAILRHSQAILAANGEDVTAAHTLSPAMIDRLTLTPARITAMAEAVRAIAAIPDPLGVETARWTPTNGLDIARVRTPIGVIAMIYEARPNVTADAAALCVRSGNAVILRGGSECLAVVSGHPCGSGRGPEGVAGLPRRLRADSADFRPGGGRRAYWPDLAARST